MSDAFLNIKKISIFKTIRFKIMCTFIIFSAVMLVTMNILVNSILTSLVENLISDKLRADINYIEDIISNHTEADWKIKNDALYFGNTLIGDGTEETANFAPFLEHEEKTGTLSYVFMLDKDADLGFVDGDKNSVGYEEGPYLRIAGTTKGPKGESIVGTYISKNVADSLEKYDYYAGEAIVSGGLIYCLYNTLKDSDGNVVGAIVVGRYTAELKQQIASYMNRLSGLMIVFTTICCFFILMLMTKWLSVMKKMMVYLKQIEDGNIPDEQLALKTKDEMSLIADSINTMVDSLKENVILRKKSETDALTNLPNRFAYEIFSKNIYKNMIKNANRNFAVEILDIDYFKEYNDNYGHQSGDKCIEIVAREIRRLTLEKNNIFACRYGGDEFIIIYQGYEKDEVESFLITLKERLRVDNINHEYSAISDKVTISQGVCFGIFQENSSIEEFLEKADDALYDVKNNNRDNYRILSL